MTLKERYKDYFLIGAAVNSRTIKSHKDLIVKEFNSITCENEMKFSRVSDGLNYDFSQADEIFEFAKSNKLSLRGHTLMWHKQTPEVIFKNTDRNGLIATLKKHIDIMAERYGNYIYCWDVANEVIEDKGSELFRKSPWYEIIGEDFCDIVFSYTKKILPNAKLCYNDYNECSEEKSKKIFKLVDGMIKRGIPVDVLGMQAHYNIRSPRPDDIRRAFELYSKLGVKIHITELDVSFFASGDESKPARPTDEMIAAQSDYYTELFAIYREYHELIECVTTWGVADDETWLDNFPVKNRKNWPLIFDENHEPKSFYPRLF